MKNVVKPPMSPDLYLICPNCDARLKSRACKMRCQRCGYFDSCSDFPSPHSIGMPDPPPTTSLAPLPPTPTFQSNP